jgi:DNA adenine methylase
MEHTTTGPKRPIINYLGGKWRLAPWIIAHFPPHKIYLEPYGGGGSVLARKDRARIEIYNELDGEIVNVFRMLRDPELCNRLHTLLELTPYAAAEVAECYAPTNDDVERARRVICRSYFLFAHDSVFRPDVTFKRSNSRAEAASWQRYINAFHLYHERLRGVTIDSIDAVRAIKFYDSPDALHYVDPPYVHSTRGDATYRHEMSDEKHRELAQVLHDAKGFVILSGYNCALYQELYGDWKREAKPTQNFLNLPCEESIWISARTEEALSQE